jgi:antitoxin component of MazEF toxin-antitoxin module
MTLRICPFCNERMRREDREISPGIFAEVEICPRCEGTTREEKIELFRRKVFDLAGSIALRLPKEVVKAIGIEEGTELLIEVSPDKRIVLAPVEISPEQKRLKDAEKKVSTVLKELRQRYEKGAISKDTYEELRKKHEEALRRIQEKLS